MHNITLISLDQTAGQVRNLRFPDIKFAEIMEVHQVDIGVVCGPLEEHLNLRSYDAIVAPGNGFGHMTGGFDAAVVNVFGQWVDDEVRQRINEDWCGELLVGNALKVELGAQESEYLIYAPTMRAPKQLPAHSDAPYAATLAALQCVERHNTSRPRDAAMILDVLLPVMGGNTGGMDIQYVARQMQLAMIRAVRKRPIEDLFNDGKHWDRLIDQRISD